MMTQSNIADNDFTPLPIGSVIGNNAESYVILRVVSATPQRIVYLVRLAPETPEDVGESRPNDLYLRLVASPLGGMAEAMTTAAMRLRHPRLLAIRVTFSRPDADYVVLDVAGPEWPPERPKLGTEEALAVGVMIGEVLTYLHGHGVAHLHIRPEVICITPQGIFLDGLEDATVVTSSVTESEALFARDANFLAQAIGVLAPATGAAVPADEALRHIVQRGTEGDYVSVREIMLDFLRALPDGLPQLVPADATQPMRLLFGKATTVGLVRTQNQDATAALILEVDDDQPAMSLAGVILVADGMGGEAQGEVASRIAARMIVAEVARRFLSPVARSTASDLPNGADQPGDAPTTMNLDSINALVEAFRAANARIRNMSRRLERAAGTTATAVMFYAHDAIIGHVGDSRAYLYRQGEMMQLTQDHSLLQRMIDLGQYTPETVGMQVPRNYLYRSLGQGDDLEVDTRIIKIGIGDTLLLCSDGLWDLVTSAEMKEVLGSERSPEEMASELTIIANSKGGTDNSTAFVARFVAR